MWSGAGAQLRSMVALRPFHWRRRHAMVSSTAWRGTLMSGILAMVCRAISCTAARPTRLRIFEWHMPDILFASVHPPVSTEAVPAPQLPP